MERPTLKQAARLSKIALAATWLLVWSACHAGAQQLKADYRFQGNLTSSVGKAPVLQTLGETGYAGEPIQGKTHQVLRFVEGSGVAVPGVKDVIPLDHYSIIMQFRLDTLQGYRRLIDFKNAKQDQGLYTLNGALFFYNFTEGGADVIRPGAWVEVMLTRDQEKRVCGYVNGRLQFTFVDAADSAVIDDANTLRFFRDDGTEHSAGAVAQIRLYDGPLVVAQRPTPVLVTAEQPTKCYLSVTSHRSL